MARAIRRAERPCGPSAPLMVSSSHRASPPSWSTIASKTWSLYFRRYATKDVTSWRRQTIPSMGNSVGSWTQRATRSNFGSHLRDSDFKILGVRDRASSLRKSQYLRWSGERSGLDREASDFRRAIGILASHLSDVSTESAA